MRACWRTCGRAGSTTPARCSATRPFRSCRYLLPLPDDYSANDVARAWTLTALLNLDGMDVFTARHLCDAEGITTLEELADQSQATLDRILDTLSRPHTPGRPRSRSRGMASGGGWRPGVRSAKISIDR